MPAVKPAEHILYELLDYVEWVIDPQLINGSECPQRGGSIFYRTIAQTPRSLLHILSFLLSKLYSSPQLPLNFKRLKESGPLWQLAVGAQGALVAVLQSSSLEIRSRKDEYSSVVGRNLNLYQDYYPMWRKIAWSPDCSMVAVGYSTGAVEIFSILGVHLFTIFPPKYESGFPQFSCNSALTAVIFTDIRTHAVKWGLFAVAGYCRYMEDNNLKNYGIGHGITLWRLLQDFPYYKQISIIDEEEYSPPSTQLFNRLTGFQSNSYFDAILLLSVSPSCRQMAALHSSGSLSIWEIPSLRKKKFWLIGDQLDRNLNSYTINSDLEKKKRSCVKHINNFSHFPVDISWWSEDAIILAKYSGAVSVNTVNSLSNLLGELPEFLEGIPQISCAYDGAFLALEMESTLISKKNVSESSESLNSESESFEVVSADAGSFLKRTSLFMKELLFWITDAERFCPPSRRPKLISRTFRLLGLKSTTPEELFRRKIENEEYGEALSLAETYNLDSDRVYQQQWRQSLVTIASIQDYLSKVKKKSYVINECLSRVPEDIDAAKELLMYGLSQTEIKEVMMNENTKDSTLCLDVSLNTDSINEIFDLEGEKMIEQILLGGPHLAVEQFNCTFFKKFRSQSSVEAAIEFAHSCDWRGVEVMFTYHGDKVLPHRLAVLSNFPSTMSPFEYRSLLPECNSEEVIFWEQEQLRDKDWCERNPCCSVIFNKEVLCDFLYKERPYLHNLKRITLSKNMISMWYLNRAEEIERCSHFVDCALDLLKLGKERNVPGLDKLHDTLDTLEVMVYEVGIYDLTLEKLMNMSDNDKVKQLMLKCSSETFIQNMQRWVMPFLYRCDCWDLGCGKILLNDYIVFLAEQGLTLPLKVFQQSKVDNVSPILSDPMDIMGLALKCIYSCKKESDYIKAFAILECLPKKKSSDDETMLQLHESVATLEAYLIASELFSTYSLNLTPLHLKDISNKPEEVISLLKSLIHSASKRKPTLTCNEWGQLMDDILELQQKTFPCVTPQKCFELLVESLLKSNNLDYIRYCKNFIETHSGGSPVHNPYLQKVPFCGSVKIVVQAAVHYCNSSESKDDFAIDLALECLKLIDEDNPSIEREKDFIEAIKIFSEFDIKKLPLQDKLHLYNDNVRQRSANILSLVADSAIQGSYLEDLDLEDDIKFATGICDQLVSERHPEGWNVCARVGRSEEVEIEKRIRFLNFALTFADEKCLEGLLNARSVEPENLLASILAPSDSDSYSHKHMLHSWLLLNIPEFMLVVFRNQMELQILCEKVSQQMEEKKSPDNAYKKKSYKISGSEVPMRMQNTGLMSKSFITSTAATTTSLVSSFTDKQFWKSALRYRSYAVPELFGTSLEYPLLLLRTALLEETLNYGGSIHIDSKVIEEVVRNCLHEDLVLGLSFLLILDNPESAFSLLSSLPRSNISFQVSLYYFALQIYSNMHPAAKPGIAPYWLCNPLDLINSVVTLINQIRDTDLSEEMLQYKKMLLCTKEVMTAYCQGQALQKLDAGVDIGRFLSDSKYKEETVLGLAMYTKTEVVQFAFALAEKYNVSLWQVSAAHLQALFDSELSADEVDTLISKHLKIEIFEQNVGNFVKHMEDNVFTLILGCDHDKLILYYRLMKSCTKDNTYMSHVNVLSKIKKHIPMLDYKKLVSLNCDILSALHHVLNSDNIDVVCNLLSSLPSRQAISQSTVYCAWVQKYFFSDDSEQTECWVQRYENCNKYLIKMEIKDVEIFINYIFMSEESLRVHPKTKKEISERILKFCKAQQQKAKTKDCQDLWFKLAASVADLVNHLNILCTNGYQRLASNSDSLLTMYARIFEISGGKEEDLHALACRILMEQSGISVLKEILSIYPDSFLTTAEDILMDVFRQLILLFKGAKIAMFGTKEDLDLLSVLDHLLKEASHIIEEDCCLLQEEEILEDIGDLCHEDLLSLEDKILILRTVQKYFPLPCADKQLLQLLNSKEIIQKHWLEDVSFHSGDIESEAGRSNLFEDILANTSTVDQILALVKLLNLWPYFSKMVYDDLKTNPFFRLFSKFFEDVKSHTQSELESLVHSIEKEYNSGYLSLEAMQKLSQKAVICCQSYFIIALRIALITDDQEIQKNILQLLSDDIEVKSAIKCLEVFPLLVKKNLVTKIIHTSLWGQLVGYLMEYQDNALLSSCLQQLDRAGYKQEVSSLAMKTSSIPRSLQNISAAVRNFRQWL